MSIQMLERLKIAANRRDIPYQSLIKVWLDEKLKQSA
jgi:predicted DNA binding CopG/RHH family protein